MASTSCNQILSPQTEMVCFRNHICHLSNTWRKVSSLSWRLLWSANHKECVTREWCLLCLHRFMAKPCSFALVLPAIEWLNSLLSFIIIVQMKRTYLFPSLQSLNRFLPLELWILIWFAKTSSHSTSMYGSLRSLSEAKLSSYFFVMWLGESDLLRNISMICLTQN